MFNEKEHKVHNIIKMELNWIENRSIMFRDSANFPGSVFLHCLPQVHLYSSIVCIRCSFPGKFYSSLQAPVLSVRRRKWDIGGNAALPLASAAPGTRFTWNVNVNLNEHKTGITGNYEYMLSVAWKAIIYGIVSRNYKMKMGKFIII